ncbi:MAG: alpha/beta fold hydrolase [Bryobacterales bacterium]|nr:alpha/beta fold hydrolase [Bryobacterales bacterium]
MKPHIVYLHGFASGPGSKKAQYFARRFAAEGIAVDIPDLAEGRFETLTLTGQLGVIERTAAGRNVSLIGSSLGGYLAALYAARHTAEVERVVLLAPGFGFAERWPVSLGEEKWRRWQREGAMPFYHYGEGREMMLHYDLIRDGVLYEAYPEVRQPCLIFHGRNDTVVPAAWSEEFAMGKPNVELHVEDSDHELLNILEPMWARVREFLIQP